MEKNPSRRYEATPEKVEFPNNNVSKFKILISFIKMIRIFAQKI
jgi:hypothetical protein